MTAEAWALDDVKNRLIVASEAGEMLSVAALRDEIGIGHDDLTSVLDALRESGDAVEGAPNEWRAPYDDERDAAPATESAAEQGDEDDEAAAAARRALDRRDRPARERAAPTAREAIGALAEDSPFTGGVTKGGVVLTQKVAGALSSETIGELVKAGISEAEEDQRAFVLRVEP